MSTSLFEHYKAALRRGHLAALAGDLDEALEAYEEAARLVPGRALPLASRGTVLHRLDRWPEAAEAFDWALQLAPDDEAALRARATARAERDLRAGAAGDFERLAFVLDVAGKLKPAAQAARRAADLEPTPPRQALAERLDIAASLIPEVHPDRRSTSTEPYQSVPAGGEAAGDSGPPEPAETEVSEAEAADAEAEAARAGIAEAEAVQAAAPTVYPALEPFFEGGYGALEALRAGFDTDERGDAATADAAVGLQPSGEDAPEVTTGPESSDPALLDLTDQSWPGIDLPSPPPPPVDTTLDPEQLLADAALALEAGEIDAARELMLTSARIDREEGRTDAALDTCLDLLAIAPGDPQVHLAITNLQLDRGWSEVATEKIDLLVRLTSLTGDMQAEADVHGLASERLRDDPATSATGR